MNKTRIEKLEIDIYSEKLSNGMDVYLIPKSTVNDIYVTFTTKYGSSNIEFIPNGEQDFYKSPYGVAHFLEHKIFEQENGEDPFSFYSKSGTSNNAYTNFHNTTYLFNGPNNFEANLNYLLDFVQEPYFTDENVAKEKGIIIQELKMHQDNPYRYGLEKLLSNSFSELPINIPTIGTIESIRNITKDDLYKCYHTFYHPNNMFLAITGNIDVEKTIKLIKENQKNKKFNSNNTIELKEYHESNKVNKEKEIVTMNVSVPKLFMGYKININDFQLPKHILIQYIGIYLDNKFGPISIFSEHLKQENIINFDIDFSIFYIDNYIEIVLIADTNQPEVLAEKIAQYIHRNDSNINDFNRKKKCFLSANIYMSDNIYKLNDKIVNDMILENDLSFDIYQEYNRLTFDEYNKTINQIDFNNQTIFIINQTDTCQKTEN